MRVLFKHDCTSQTPPWTTWTPPASPVTVLFMAVHHADIVRLLPDRGANVDGADPVRHTPLRVAVGAIHPGAPPRDPDSPILKVFYT